MAVRLIRRVYDGEADHYEAMIYGEDLSGKLASQDPITAAKLRKLRKGKKTVAIVGMAPTTCSLAPFDDPNVEIWGLNEAHAFEWMKRWDRWFQIHATESWKRYIAKRDIRGHFDWLMQKHVGDTKVMRSRLTLQGFWSQVRNKLEYDDRSNAPHWKQILNNLFRGQSRKEHLAIIDEEKLKPIYMQYWHQQVPNSLDYPLWEVQDKFFANFRRGDDKVKYFTSTFAYMMGIALLEGFDRIEVYGFEMADDIEYVQQKACAEFWIGLAMGKDVEVYTPPNTALLYSDLYGGNEQGAGW
jgi:hypothetical protein